MKLYDVVFTKDKITKLDFVETSSNTNTKYKKIYIENDKTAQRYFLSKDIIRNIIKSRKDKSKITYPVIMECVSTTTNYRYVLNTYEFKDIVANEDIRNNNVVLDVKADEDCDNQRFLSIAIDNDTYQLIDYEGIGGIIQTGRRNEFQTCLINILDELDSPFIISITVRSIDDNNFDRYNLFISEDTFSIYSFDLKFSDPHAYKNYLNMLNTNDKFYKNFKISSVYGLCTEVVLVNQKYVEEADDDIFVPVIQNNNIPGKNYVKMIVPCTDEMINNEGIDDTLNEAILSKNIRTITVLGIKLNKDFYKKYKILYMYSYNPKTRISVCAKTN